MSDSAILSPCGLYRYLLQRGEYQPGKTCAIVMLNPSTADATNDDPTIRKLKGFTADWGYSSFTVANLYALRSTDPKQLWKTEDPIGPDNDAYLSIIGHYPLVVVAWGANAKPLRASSVLRLLRANGSEVYCLGKNADGSPKHPLYVSYAQRLLPYDLTPPSN